MCLLRPPRRVSASDANEKAPLPASPRGEAREAGPRVNGSPSIAVGADDLAVGPGAEGPVGLHVDRILDELDAPVPEREVAAAGVVARGVDELRLAGRRSSCCRSLQRLQGYCFEFGGMTVLNSVKLRSPMAHNSPMILHALAVRGAGGSGPPDGVALGQRGGQRGGGFCCTSWPVASHCRTVRWSPVLTPLPRWALPRPVIAHQRLAERDRVRGPVGRVPQAERRAGRPRRSSLRENSPFTCGVDSRTTVVPMLPR